MPKKSRAKTPKLYEDFITLPDKLYPFSFSSHGKRVRGSTSYNHELARALKRYGKGHIGYKLVAYRETFHFVGAVLFILFAALVSRSLLGGDTALYVLLGAALVAITFQEFYLHPRMYGQLLPKGVVDWLAWSVPIGLYLFMHLS